MTIILLVSAVIGAKVLALFGIGLPAFQVGGGIILFLIAVQMTLVGVTGTTMRSPHPSITAITIRRSTSRSCRWRFRSWPGRVPSAARFCTEREPRRSHSSPCCAASRCSWAWPPTVHYALAEQLRSLARRHRHQYRHAPDGPVDRGHRRAAHDRRTAADDAGTEERGLVVQQSHLS